jgi:type VI secretion system protein ImpG
VSAVSDFKDNTQAVAPYFSYDHAMGEGEQQAFWHIRREDTGRASMPGTEVHLAFTDLDFLPALPPHQTVYAHAWCTNRDLPEQLQAGAGLQIEAAVPVLRSETRPGILLLTKPTRQRAPPLEGAGYWRLISHLSMNYLSIAEGDTALRALRELLRLYTFDGEIGLEHAAQGIRAIESKRVVRRVGQDAWRGQRRGTEITLTLDERRFTGTSAYLFSAVLSRYFALQAPVNSFVSLVIKRTDRDEPWYRWPPSFLEQ